MKIRDLPFRHRPVPEGTASICTACLMTIATKAVEDDLIEIEKTHHCADSDWMRRRDQRFV